MIIKTYRITAQVPMILKQAQAWVILAAKTVKETGTIKSTKIKNMKEK